MPFSYMNDVNEHLSVYQLTNDVLRAAYAKPNLARPEICPIVNVNRLHIRQPVLGQLKVTMGVREYESIGTQTPNASHKDVELLNDRIAVQVSAEAQIENNYGDCISMIAEEQGLALGKALEIWIANAMTIEPLRISSEGMGTSMQSALIDCANQWHRYVVPHAIQLLGDWEPTAVCMHPVTWAAIQPIFNGASNPSGNIPYTWMNNQIPGFNCPVVTSTYIEVGKIYVVSAKATAMRCYQYDTMTPILDYDPVINADTMYAGIWRTVASGFRKTKTRQWDNRGKAKEEKQEGNAGIVEISLTGTYFELSEELPPLEKLTVGSVGTVGSVETVGKVENVDNLDNIANVAKDAFYDVADPENPHLSVVPITVGTKPGTDPEDKAYFIYAQTPDYNANDSEKYVEAMNKDIYDNIEAIGGEYIARQSKLLKAADAENPDATLKGMKKAFTPPRRKKASKDTEE